MPAVWSKPIRTDEKTATNWRKLYAEHAFNRTLTYRQKINQINTNDQSLSDYNFDKTSDWHWEIKSVTLIKHNSQVNENTNQEECQSASATSAWSGQV